MRVRHVFNGSIVCASLAACSLLDIPDNATLDVDATSGPDAVGPPIAAEASIDGSKDSDADADADAASRCQYKHGSTPVDTGYGFCIDSTEVTFEEFDDFLLAMGAEFTESHGQDGGASVDMDQSCGAPLWPTEGSGGSPRAAAAPTSYCQAKAYCNWAGKHLCGKIGGGTLATTHSESSSDPVNNPAVSEWYLACSRDGGRQFPYGNEYDATVCNIDSRARASVLPWRDGSCQGGVDGVYDMAGNANEWIDSCGAAGDGTHRCHLRGGSAFTEEAGSSTAAQLGKRHSSCALKLAEANMWVPVDAAITNNAWSFRCCSTLR